jgi:hypothetical protein
VADAGFELLDPAVWRAAPFGEKNEVPSGLQQLARAVKLRLRATGSGEREGVEK